MTQRPVGLAVLLVALAGAAPAAAQLITIRTVPVSVDDQFLIFPSQRSGMANVSIALADTLLDPFSNPAAAVRLRSGQLFGAPTFYGVSKNAGSGRTLPLGVFGASGDVFGGAWAALQQVQAARPGIGFPPPGVLRVIDDPGGALTGLDARSHRNQFVFASAGKVLRPGFAVAGSVSWAGLHAIDGVDLLYANSQGVRQSGHSLDLRLGALQEHDGRSLEAVLLHNRYRMTDDVTQLELFWDPGTQTTLERASVQRNRNYTDTWGAHLHYEIPLVDSIWRIGWIVTANRMTHPQVPEYEFASVRAIPWDPGESYAYNLGLGVSKRWAGTLYGLDLVYEPIWTHTWADAPVPVVDGIGDTIPAGGTTLENRFVFSNMILRMGLTRDLHGEPGTSHGLELGIVLRSIAYRLRQFDRVQLSGRRLSESWMEWTPTWGLRLGFPGVAIRYQGRITFGTGRPGVSSGVDILAAPDAAGGGILAVPTGALTLSEVRVMTHQFSISLPLR